ncbi:TlpA disulfide reductase family protein [uncultured Rhodoferax sp.]|uniref:TlpA family protein disulfide reductase n=1 Tax=uncultured Rhodoferax sp. TaxID=223188 RepID=UPI0025DF1FC4|nr:TlpA disulfide reductase family protein [uncultured Rhodoferax sp.]
MTRFCPPLFSARLALWVSVLVLLSLASALVHAQTGNPPWQKGEALKLDAVDAAGRPLAVDRLRGQVLVVFVWSTACAVCRDSLPELRANANGWQSKPFALLAVNADARTEDWTRYEALVAKTLMPTRNWLSLRLREALPAGQRLPLTLLVDRNGKILQRFEGRLAPEVWDSVADLLP